MDIQKIIFLTPIPKYKEFVNSDLFLKVIWNKLLGLSSLIIKENEIVAIQKILDDLVSAERIIDNTDNLVFTRYLIGTKYIELGLKYEKDEYLVKGMEKLDLIEEENISTVDLRAEYYRLFSKAILIHFNSELRKDSNYKYSFDSIKPLLKAKYFLFKLYGLLIEKKIRPKVKHEASFMSDLVAVLIFLSRWNEPFFILRKSTVIAEYSPGFLNYLKAHTLTEIASNTCCTIYDALVSEIKEFVKKAQAITESEDDWREELLEIDENANQIIKSNKIDLNAFEQNYSDEIKYLKEHTEYRRWILENHFGLCEHSLYCSCGFSKSDDLSIKTNHEHTKIEWVSQFEVLLDKMKSEYNLARYFLFLSEDDSKLAYIRTDELKSNLEGLPLLSNSKSDFLFQAFKSSYSILYKIGRAVYLALDINQKDIYFHNCWKKVKEKNVGSHNRYLYTLYSIACDLSDTSEYSAFREYKSWRNMIEHEYLFLITENEKEDDFLKRMPIIKEVIKLDEFREKTYYMLQLCRSAIFSFVFFIRHETKQKETVKDVCELT